jgi:hypothetical protein
MWQEAEKDSIMRSFAKYYYGEQVKEYKMGGTCSTDGSMRNTYNILVANP